jgi:type IV pilus assembly protein PilA
MRRSRPIADVRGFTLVEVLVCLLIMSILLAILLPSFLDQRAKGEDADAKLTLRTAALAMHAHYVDNETFAATVADLERIEPSLSQALDLRVTGTADTYEIRERSASNTEFTMTRAADGEVSRDCSHRGYGFCRDAADASGDFW